MKFVDEARIHVRSGKGGKGCISFRREKYIPKGGPDGGDGGRGGDVILVASPHVQSLLDLSYQRHLKAKNGAHGRGKNQHGGDGEELVARVPLGTLVRDGDTGEILGDLTAADQRLVVARGGHGGKGNGRFATATRQAPRFSTPPGEGETRAIVLTLKLLADVGLVGFPNAGKSSLLARVSAARPRIASYPFTTLVPNLGVAAWGEDRTMVLADVPGLLEGAHKGVGLGLRFLRHVERTRVLLYVLDLDPGRETALDEDLRTLREEVGRYQPDLLDRPTLVAMNKVDLPGAAERADAARRTLEGEGFRVFAVSALTGEGIEGLMDALGREVQAARVAAEEDVSRGSSAGESMVRS
jgi:GTP-binding protein